MKKEQRMALRRERRCLNCAGREWNKLHPKPVCLPPGKDADLSEEPIDVTPLFKPETPCESIRQRLAKRIKSWLDKYFI